MIFERIPCGPLDANTYLLSDDDATLLAVDPADADVVSNYCAAHGRTLTHILLTHRHFDHIAGVAALCTQTHCRVCIHADDAKALSSPNVSLSTVMGQKQTPCSATDLLHDGDCIQACGLCLRVLHTAGHSAGGVTFVCDAHQFALTGDTLFADGFGRTDLPTGNTEALLRSIRETILSLPESYRLYPGHGADTTVAYERLHNPAMQGGFGAWYN